MFSTEEFLNQSFNFNDINDLHNDTVEEISNSNESNFETKEQKKHSICRFCNEDITTSHKHQCAYLMCQNTKNFLCRICNKELSKKSFSYHISTHNMNNLAKIVCTICSKEFTNSRLLNLHLTIHSGTKPHPCIHCEQSFLTKMQLTRHLGSHGIPPQLYKCHLCFKEFSYNHYLTLHLRMHNDPIFKCNLCNRNFERKDYLNDHMTSKHSIVKNFVCDVCNNSFKLKKYLKRHQIIHQIKKDEDFSCKVCCKVLSHKKQLENHLLLHQGDRRFVCESCGISFITQSALTNHSYKHRPHPVPPTIKCTFCDELFSRRTDLKRHLNSHPNQKPYECFYCDKTYYKKNQLERHLCIHTGKPPVVYKCKHPGCGKELSQKYYLDQHTITKHNPQLKFCCTHNNCSKRFATKTQYNRHRKTCNKSRNIGKDEDDNCLITDDPVECAQVQEIQPPDPEMDDFV